MNSDCTRTKLSAALLRKGRPGEDRRDRNLKLSMPKVRSLLLLAIPALLHLCSPLLAGPSRLLLREFDRAISRWVVRDSEGIRYLLTARRGPEGRPGFALRISRNTRPRSLEDFLPRPTSSLPGVPGNRWAAPAWPLMAPDVFILSGALKRAFPVTA